MEQFAINHWGRCCYTVKAENISFLPSIKRLPPRIISTYKINLVVPDYIPNIKPSPRHLTQLRHPSHRPAHAAIAKPNQQRPDHAHSHVFLLPFLSFLILYSLQQNIESERGLNGGRQGDSETERE